jgi:hypothetical protein
MTNYLKKLAFPMCQNELKSSVQDTDEFKLKFTVTLGNVQIKHNISKTVFLTQLF